MPRILLADDHSVVRRQVRQKLESEEGFEVCAEAANGLEAVTLTASALPDFAILDLSMPQMNGLEAARQIHQRFPTVEMLILTMYDPVQFMDEVIASGVRTCILKTDLHHLVATIRSIWEQRQSRISKSSPDHAAESHHITMDVDAEKHRDPLTDFERQIVQMLAQARSNKEIAAAMVLTVKAVEVHRAAIMCKLKINSMFDLVHYAIGQKLVQTATPSKRAATGVR